MPDLQQNPRAHVDEPEPMTPTKKLRLAIELIQRNTFKSSQLQMAENLLLEIEAEVHANRGE